MNIILYYDELTITNPLGHTAKEHKYGMFYFTIADIPKELRSHLDLIFLVACVRAEMVNSDEIDNILSIINDNLHELFIGKLMSTSDGDKKIRGVLSLLVGDTPAINRLLGLKEGVGFSYCKCRHCFATKDDFDLLFEISLFKQRNVEEHKLLCAQLLYSQTQATAADFSKQYGINRYSKIFEINSFCSFDPFIQTPHDVMHILFEGITPHTLREFFTDAYSGEINKYQIADLQITFDKFKCHPLDVNDYPKYLKLNSFTELNSHINLTASSTWTFFRLFPIIFASNLKEFRSWPVLEILFRLTSNLMSHKFTPNTQNLCKSLVIQFITTYRTIFANSSFLPKMHYLLHIVDAIPKLGPPSSYWCMRFEAKHKQFKSVSRNSNFHNILSDFSFKHSLQMSYISSHSTLEEPPSFTNFRLDSNSFNCNNCTNKKMMETVTKISSNYNTYCTSDLLLLAVNPRSLAAVGMIDKMYC